MKNGKRPTVKQKILLKDAGLNPDEWLIVKNLSDKLVIVHRSSGSIKTINLGGF